MLRIIRLADFIGTDGQRLANSAYCLTNIGLTYEQIRSGQRWVVDELGNAIGKAASWAKLDAHTGEGIAAAIRLVRTREAAEKVLAGIAVSPIEATSDLTPVHGWVDAAHEVLKEIDDQHLAHTYAGGVPVPADPARYFAACKYALKARKHESVFIPQKVDEMVAVLTSDIASGALADQHLAAIQVLLNRKHTVPWQEVSDAISSRLQLAEIAHTEVPLLLTALWDVEKTSASPQSTITPLCTGGYILHHLHQCYMNENLPAVGWCVFTFLSHVPNADAGQEFGDSVAGHGDLLKILEDPTDIIVGFTQCCIRYDQLSRLFDVLQQTEQAGALVLSCLRRMAEQQDAIAFTPEMLTGHWSLLKANFYRRDIEPIVRHLLRRTDLVAYICDRDFNPELAGLYLILVRLGTASDSRFRSWCLNGLKTVGKDEWEAALKGGDLVKLVIELLDRDIAVKLGTPYRDALIDHARRSIAGETRSAVVAPLRADRAFASGFEGFGTE